MIKTIIPTCTDALILNCLESMERSEVNSTASVIVGDNGLSLGCVQEIRDRFPMVSRVKVPTNPFIHMQALNAILDGYDHSLDKKGEYDILVLGDDSEIVTPRWLYRAEHLLRNWPAEAGMLNFIESEQLKYRDYSFYRDLALDNGTLGTEPFYPVSTQPLAGSLIPRRAYEKAGRFDERFVGYGYDDVDYCVRMLHSGLQCGVTFAVEFRHKGRVSFENALKGHGFLITMSTVNRVLFYEKWGLAIEPAGYPDAGPHLNRALCLCGPGDGTKQ